MLCAGGGSGAVATDAAADSDNDICPRRVLDPQLGTDARTKG